MKIYSYGNLLALCAFRGTTAFHVQTPRSLTLTARQTGEGVSPCFSYLENSGGGPSADGDVDDGMNDMPVRDTSESVDIPPFPSLAAQGRKIESQISTTQRAVEEGRQSVLDKESFDTNKVSIHSPHDEPFPWQVWDRSSPVIVQGGSLKTWSYTSSAVQRVQLVVNTDGRPLDADVELWQGPDNTPQRMRVYAENGNTRPFSTILETPRGPDTVAIRNIGQLEFPMAAHVVAETAKDRSLIDMPFLVNGAMLVQGGAIRTYPFDSSVESVQVFLRSDGRPLNARVELIQGPNNIKQVIELYAEDGRERQVYFVLETPGSGNVVRIVNLSTVEFPLTASVEPYLIGPELSDLEAVIGGGPEGLVRGK